MKKFLCLLCCILGCLFFVFWVVVYVAFMSKETISQFVYLIMLINVVIIVLALILGFCVIRISVDQWFQNDNADIMSTKDKVLITTAVLITLICTGIFVLTIINNNIHSIRVTETDNMLLRMLMLIIANTYMAFAYYQHFQVAQANTCT